MSVCEGFSIPFKSTTKLFIDGKFIDSKTEDWLPVHNPVSYNFVLNICVMWNEYENYTVLYL